MKTRWRFLIVMLVIMTISPTRADARPQPNTPVAQSNATSVPVAPPNILFIVTDDLSQGALSCYGQTAYQTPGIDALAAAGMRFTRAYTGSTPLCSPSRWTLMVGSSGLHNGVRTNVGDPPDQGVTYAEAFKQVLPGVYQTAYVGQWNQAIGPYGVVPFSTPNGQGFDEFFGTLTVQEKALGYPSQVWSNGQQVPNATYTTDLYSQKAVDLINGYTTAGTPWCVTLAYNMPHCPAPIPADGWSPTFTGLFGGNTAYQQYAARIARMDQWIGIIRNNLPDPANTWVVFVGDHPDFTTGGGPNVAAANYFGVNLPYKGGGGIRPQNEGALRIPLIVNGPGVPADNVCNGQIEGTDIFPTIMAIAGVTIDPTWSVTGRSQLSVWQSGTPLPDVPMYREANNFYYQAAWDVTGWKLLRTNGGSPELYNLNADPGETTNLAASNPAKVSSLTAQMVSARTSRVLPAPDNLTITVIGQGSLRLDWRHNSGRDELGFKIERSLNGTSWSQIATRGEGVYFFPNNGLTAGTIYYYRVRAYDSVGNSQYGNVASGTP